MPIYQHKEDTHLINPQSVNWINTLPSLEGKTILKFGSRKPVHLQMLLVTGCRQLICVGEINESLKAGALSYVPTIEQVDSRIDVCIIDEPEFFYEFKAGKRLKEVLQKIDTLLAEDGTILIGFPSEFKFYRARRQALALIRKIFSTTVDMFICQPSFYFPMFIYPFSQAPGVIRRMLIGPLFTSLTPKKIARDILKFFIYHLNILANPLIGLYFIAQKDGAAPTENSSLSSGEKVSQEMFTIWMSKPWGQKQIGLNYCIEKKGDCLLNSITKQSTPALHRTEALRQEYTNLQILQSMKDELRAQKIEVPEPLSFTENSHRITFIQGNLEGELLYGNWLAPSISSQTLNSKISGQKDLISKLVNLQIKLQKFLRQLPLDKMTNLSEKYFDNLPKNSNAFLKNSERLKSYQVVVQHGDFAKVNILYNPQKDLWGIIDWEWMAAGYPPLFDLWSLFKSFAYRTDPAKKMEMFDAAFQSLVDSFFQKNWFSDFIKKRIIEYCKIFEIDLNMVYGYFLDYALISTNKYLYDFNMPQFEALFNRILAYALENPQDFLIDQRSPDPISENETLTIDES